VGLADIKSLLCKE